MSIAQQQDDEELAGVALYPRGGRTTGATDEQIEASARRWGEAENSLLRPVAWDELADMTQRVYRIEATEHARWLVTPSQRVVEVEDLRLLMRGTEYRDLNADDEQDAIDRLRALIGDDA